MIGIAGVFVWRRRVIGMLSKSPDPPSWGSILGTTTSHNLAQAVPASNSPSLHSIVWVLPPPGLSVYVYIYTHIYNYIIHILQLLQSGGSTQSITFVGCTFLVIVQFFKR